MPFHPPCSHVGITDLWIRNQLYFDRVYPFIPILQQGRYFSWAKQRSPSGSHLCLKYAVWTMAASLSSQFQHLRDGLYHDTRQMLEALENEDYHQEDAFYLQQAQAWILVAVYNSCRRHSDVLGRAQAEHFA